LGWGITHKTAADRMFFQMFKPLTRWQRNIYFTYSTTGLDGLGVEIINLTENISGNQLRPDMIYGGSRFHIVFTDNGVDAVQYLTIDMTTSIAEYSLSDFKMDIAPNPVGDVLNITLSGYRNGEKYEAIVRDSMGNLIKRLLFASDGKLQMDFSELASGNYSLCLMDHNSEISVK
jgi:Secretion system C-terminal sorting domain